MESARVFSTNNVADDDAVQIPQDKKHLQAESPGSRRVISSGSGGSLLRKNGGGLKDGGHSSLYSINKTTRQIKKPFRRNVSPLNWFPRKKTESFLKRKIRLLQEVGGMNTSLDETLGDSNPHYSRIAREKIAAREAAEKAMRARKAAMVEASWCRILRAAGIQSKEAEAQLEKSEKYAEKAFEAATAMGVMMYDKHDGPRHSFEIETSSRAGGASTHTVTASFVTAFEIDKEVASAVKRAFIQLASSSSSSNKEEFRDLLRKITQNPDSLKVDEEPKLPSGSETFAVPPDKDSDICNAIEASDKMKERKLMDMQLLSLHGNKVTTESFSDLVGLMLERLKGLKEDQLSPLVKMVATCGLNAVLQEVNGNMKKTEATTEVPSLDKFLVKHVSRLEREVQEAKHLRQRSSMAGVQKILGTNKASIQGKTADACEESTSDLGSILVKHVCRLKREINEAKAKQNSLEGKDEDAAESSCQDSKSKSSSYSKQEKEQQEASLRGAVYVGHDNKENIDGGVTKNDENKMHWSKPMSRIERCKMEALRSFSSKEGDGDNEKEDFQLDRILVKPIHRLEKEKMQVLSQGNDYMVKRENTKNASDNPTWESLDKILVKPVSKLEREKLAFRGDDSFEVKRKQPEDIGGESLDEILVKHQSKLEKSKMAATQESQNQMKHAGGRREARERELQEAWGGLSLGNSIRPHVSRLEREKAAWRRAEEEERRRLMEQI